MKMGMTNPRSEAPPFLRIKLKTTLKRLRWAERTRGAKLHPLQKLNEINVLDKITNIPNRCEAPPPLLIIITKICRNREHSSMRTEIHRFPLEGNCQVWAHTLPIFLLCKNPQVTTPLEENAYAIINNLISSNISPIYTISTPKFSS